MRLDTLVCLENEAKDILEKYKDVFAISIYNNPKHLVKAVANDKNLNKRILLIAATDQTIAIGKQLGIATMAYVNPDFPNQSYGGVEMIVEGFDEVDADFLEKVYQRWHHIPWAILETERCFLREMTLEDLDGLFELYADEETGLYTEKLRPYEEEKEYQRAYINHMYRYFGYGIWLVFSKETGELIGRAGLEHREIHGKTELELGYLIGKKYQGKGYATEVCKAILDYAKENTDFEHINCVIREENKASVHLAEKLGFKYVEKIAINGRNLYRFVREMG